MNKEGLSPGLTAYGAESMTSDAPAPTNNDMIARNIKKHHFSFICSNKNKRQRKENYFIKENEEIYQFINIFIYYRLIIQQ